MRPTLEFFCAGEPKAQPRAKAARIGNFTRVYDPGSANDWKMIVRNECAKVWDKVPFVGPVWMEMRFTFARPKGHFRSNGSLKDSSPNWHTTKPDCDNLAKAVLDALTNLGVFHDDKQVSSLLVRKFYCVGQVPGAVVLIGECEQ